MLYYRQTGLFTAAGKQRGLMMRRFFQTILPVLAVIFLPISSPVAAADNRVANPSFSGDLAPWWADGQGIARQTLDGRPAVVIASGYVAQQNIAVEGGKSYRLSLGVQSLDTPAEALFVQVSFRGGNLQPQWFGPLDAGMGPSGQAACGTTEPSERTEKAAFVFGGDNPSWQERTVVIKAPAEADQAIIYLRKKPGTPGRAAYTDISLVETDEAATTPAEALRQRLTDRFAAPVADAANRAQLEAQLAAGGNALASHAITRDNALAMAVHAGADEDIITLQAAADLADYATRLTRSSREPALSQDAAVAAAPLLVVGRQNALARAAFTDGDFADLGEDGFRIRSFGPHILIAGNTPRGTMYGVNWFLDHKLGFRWLSPDATYIPCGADLSLPRLDERQVPRFAYREVQSKEAENKPWRARNLMNGQSHGPATLSSPPGIDSWNTSWAGPGLRPSFYELLPQKTYGADHPEWYAGGQLAMMNEEMRAAMADVTVKRLQALPDYRKVWFSVHDNDWGWDMDPASRAFAAQHGGHPSAPRLDMMIDIAERVKSVLPDARLAFNPYHWSFTPPQGMTIPEDMLVYPMTIHVNYAQALNEPANAALGRDLEGWNSMARHVMVWDHITNFAGFVQPTPNILPIARSIKWLATLEHVEGYMAEGSFNTPGAEFAALRAWMISRLLWNPDLDPAAVIAEFCDKYYGPAAKPILDYITFYHDKIGRSGDVLAEKTTVDMAMFDAEFVCQAEGLFNAAERLAAGTPYLQRVRAARAPVDYVILRRADDYAAQADAIGFDVKDGLAEREERFFATLTDERITQYAQGASIKELRGLFEIARTLQPVPPQRPSFVGPDTPWHDIQDIALQRFAGTSSLIIPDPLASDGTAVALTRNASGWNTQLKFDKLPRTGTWWLYAAIRSENNAPGATIAALGSAPPMSCSSPVANGPGLEQGYQWFEVPGGPFAFSTDHAESIYLQPAQGAATEKVLLDRLVAVEQRLPPTEGVTPGRDCGR